MRDDDPDPSGEPAHDPEQDPRPVDPDDADEAGFVGGSGGPASIIYGEDDEADEHGDRLARAPD